MRFHREGLADDGQPADESRLPELSPCKDGEPVSVRKRGDRWICVVEAGEHGRRRRVQQTFDRKKDALLYEARLRQQAASGTLISPDKLTVAQYADRWLVSVDVAPSTRRRYGELLRHVTDEIGDVPLIRLKALHVQGLYDALRKRGTLAPRTILHTHRVLHTALSRAVSWQLVPTNVTEAVETPRAPRIEMRALDAAETRRLLTVASADGSVYAALVSLAVHTGMREGELMALRWQDVDLDAGHLTVRGSLQRQQGVGLVRRAPKTAGSERTIPFGPEAKAVLVERRRKQIEERLRLGPDYAKGDYILTTIVGTPVQQGNLWRAWRRIRERAGLQGVRIHDLRHTHATLLLATGTPINAVAQRLGHASPTLTLSTYGHVLPGQQEEAVIRLEALLR